MASVSVVSVSSNCGAVRLLSGLGLPSQASRDSGLTKLHSLVNVPGREGFTSGPLCHCALLISLSQVRRRLYPAWPCLLILILEVKGA